VSAPRSAEGHLPGFDGATEWLNSEPLPPAVLRGRVVLVQFWTYTCINWIRTLPYVRGWAERYEDQGLVVIGVHTPEFPFERDLENVRQAAKEMRVQYPIAVDSDYVVWDAFANRYWPAQYFVDADGRIRHHRFGEGEYERSELVIRDLLAEAGAEDVGAALASVDGDGVEADANWGSLRTPETYLGYQLTQGFASPGGLEPNDRHLYRRPTRLTLNQWALEGEWTVGGGAAELNERGGRIAFRFHARDLHLVMRRGEGGAPAPFRVLIDGQPPGDAHGVDVDEDGGGTLREPRLYQLVRQPGRVTERAFEISFLEPGVEAYVFTFG
jgi:thiol-disulfide isomerase/thioredoxin